MTENGRDAGAGARQPAQGGRDAREFLAVAGIDADAIAPEVDGKFMSAFVRARKPAR